MIEIVQKSSVMHYQPKQGTFLKIYTSLPKQVNQLRGIFENGSYTFKQQHIFSSITYESNLPYALRFMIDNEIVGMSWIRVDPTKYRVRTTNRQSNCQIEIDVENFNDAICLPCEGEHSKIAPLRILSFDIECSAEKGKFPQA